MFKRGIREKGNKQMDEELNPQPLPPGEVRGSQKLLRGLARNGEMPSLSEIKQALGLEGFSKNWSQWQGRVSCVCATGLVDEGGV